MLIPSHRHTRKDLDLWRSHEEADHLHAEGIVHKIDAALAGLREFAGAGQIGYCSVSWGKDSVVVAHMAWTFDRSIPLVHLRPTNHNPDCDLVRDAYFSRYPGQLYYEIGVDYSQIDRVRLTSHEVDKATDREWYRSIEATGKRFGERAVLGLRADESAGRGFRDKKYGINSSRTCAPITRFSAQDVFSYLAAHKLPVHPAYAMLGGGRWPRKHLRVAEIGDTHGTGMGRREWESEYYGDFLAKVEFASRKNNS